MSHPRELDLQTLQFYSTAAYPCSYLADRDARSLVAAPVHLIDTDSFSQLVEQGFRRSGLFTYRPHCDRCQACVPVRVDVEAFTPTRSQKRAWKRHGALVVSLRALERVDEHFDLYCRYLRHRHPDNNVDAECENQYAQFLMTSQVNSFLAEFRLPDGTLQGVSVIDELTFGLSSVYTFFDPDAAGSLGVYAILWQIEESRRRRLPWLYLGYWIEESRKMAYKIGYQPLHAWRQGAWHPLPPSPPSSCRS